MSGLASPTDCIIRQATGQDYPYISQIFNQNIKAGDSTLWEKEFSTEDISEMSDQMDDREGLYVAEQEGQIVGWGMIRKYHLKKGYAHACETSVFLDRSERGKGYGSKLKKYLMGQCAALNYHHINAKIMADNKASISYNLKLGYEIVGVQKEIGWKNGRWVDVVIMQYIFS